MYDSNYLNTKLYMPSVRENYVSRETLIGKINENLKKEHKIILVSAEAGYGKTTLMSGWLSQLNQSFSWLSLDEYDNDPITFLKYFVMAIRKVNESFGKTIENIMSTLKLPRVEVISSYILEEFAGINNRFILVLDDYHIIANTYIHKLMQRLIDSNINNILFIILTRQDPPLNLSRWRAGDRLTELRSSDLRFETDEIKEFFSKKFNISFEYETLKMLEEKTEGWAAGLQLIGLSLKNIKKEQQESSFIEQFNGNNRFIADYIMEEVYQRQDAQLRIFLKKTSVLKGFNADLCDAVTGLSNSKQIIERLERDNLFIVPLDSSRTWYRYHHLFSGFLRTGIDENMKKEIFRKASVWCKAEGCIESAFEYALDARDSEMTLSLVNQVSSQYLHNGAIEALLELLDSVKEISNKTDPKVETYRAWCLFLLGKTGQAYKILKELLALQGIMDSEIYGKIQSLEAIIYTDIDKSRAVMLAEEAVSILKDEDRLFYNIALRTLGLVKISAGAIPEATSAFKKIIEGVDFKNYRFIELSAFINYTECLIAMGRRREAQNLCEELLAEYTDQYGEPLAMAKMVYLTIGKCFYIGNELEKARRYLHEGITFLREMKLVSTMGNAEGVYIKLLYIIGEKSNAFKTAYKYLNLSKISNFYNVYEKLEALEIDLSIKEKNHIKVIEWMRERVHCPLPGYAKLTYIRGLIYKEMYNEAESLLMHEKESAKRSDNYEQLITILILTALVKKCNGAESEALIYIEEAVKLAAPEGYIRNFLDEDSDIMTLVQKVRYVAPDFVDQMDGKKPGHSNALAEPLKAKEYEILRLIAAGLSNAEISDNLYITTGTVKWYIKNIYAKMGVNKRTQAIKKARQFGII